MWQPAVNPYRFNVIQDLKDEGIFRPAAEALFLKRVADFRRDDPVTNCLPSGPLEMLSSMYRIIQSSPVVAVLHEGGMGRYRQIYMDGRKLPKDPNPIWLGYSVGHWEDDTLVVETRGLNGKQWLDHGGLPASDKLTVTERFRRPNVGRLEIAITISDPTYYTRPWTATTNARLMPDTELFEFVCNENEKSTPHMGPHIK
jgi:hypothetical protein